MKKILIEHKKDLVIAYVLPRKEEQFNKLVEQAKNECKIAKDKKGIIEHIVGLLNRNGFKTLKLSDIKHIKV